MGGPSKEFLADEMGDTFRVWAAERVQSILQSGHVFDDDETPEDDLYEEFQRGFISALEEVEV